jgi:hypothetical protein
VFTAGCAFGSVFAPGEPHQQGVEDGEGDQADRRVHGEPVQLIADECQQQRHQPRVGPQVVSQHEHHEHQLRYAVAQQIDRAEQRGRRGQVAGRMQEVTGDEIVWVLGQLVRGQGAHDVVDLCWAKEQK